MNTSTEKTKIIISVDGYFFFHKQNSKDSC